MMPRTSVRRRFQLVDSAAANGMNRTVRVFYTIIGREGAYSSPPSKSCVERFCHKKKEKKKALFAGGM